MAEIVLGRLKFKWQGNWAAGTAYIKDDVVAYGGISYVAVENHTSDASDFNVDLTANRWEQMIGGVAWRSDWATSTVYKINDLVKYGPSVYICTDNHTSASTFAANSSKFSIFASGVVAEGEYNNGTLYQVGDIVTYGGATFICTVETQGNVPTDQTKWSRLVDGQQFEGNYDNGAQYQKGDIVIYGGYGYVASQDSLGNAPTNPSYWSILFKAYKENNTFDAGTTYVPGDVVDYGGNKYVVKAEETPTAGTLPTDTQYWDLFLSGASFQGDYSGVTAYKPGEVVRYGGRQYICIQDASGGINPTNGVYWTLYSRGMEYKGAWSSGTTYIADDVVEYSGSAYIALQQNSASQPDTNPSDWSALAVGDISSPMTTEGDMIYRNSGGSIERLPIGPAGSFLISNNGVPTWGHTSPQNDYYVSLQGDDTNDGRTPGTAWRTLRHACDQTYSLGQTKINIFAGTYTEQCPMKIGKGVVVEGNGLGAVTVSPDTTNDNGFGPGVSDDGSTPNANSDIFHLNNGARLRNIVFRNFSTGAVCVSLDPGYGPDDTSVWITSQSPYVQNCTSFTPGGTGMWVDGALHNGGYKSMVANDWTQINSDGIGIRASSDARIELVSVFTYYCQTGYLAESGAKIRALVGNNSYGEYGAVARGFSQAETPITGNIQLQDDTINSAMTINGVTVHLFTSYRTAGGELIAVGHTNPTASDASSTWDNTASYPCIVKFNNDQSVDWIYTYESTFGAIHSVVELDNSIYAGGVAYDGGTNKGFILKVSGSGEIQWAKVIGDTDEIVDLTAGPTYIYAVGDSITYGATVVRMQPSGIVNWSKALDYNDSSTNTLIGTSIAYASEPTTSTDSYTAEGDATALDNLYITAHDGTTGEQFVVRMTNAGVLVNAYEYGTGVRFNKIVIDTGNGDGIYLAVAGSKDPAGTKQPYVARLDILGNIEWQKAFTTGSDVGEFKDVIAQGTSVYACGYNNTTSGSTFNRGFITQLSSNGTLVHEHFITESTNSVVLNGIALDGVNVITVGNYTNKGVVLNFQRGSTLTTLGSAVNQNFTIADASTTESSSSFATRTIQNVFLQAPSLSATDVTYALNQAPGIARTVEMTRAGFAGIGNGTTFTFNGLTREPKDGSVLQITGDTTTYFVIGVNDFDGQTEANITIDPPIPSNKTPDDNTSVVFREAFSQVRMTGHDFLDIGTGGFADTNYPVIIRGDYTQQPDQTRETLSESGGRVFYVTTDQDGNFRVGDYFKIEQATGRATLSSEEFDLSGLNELQLGSIKAGKIGATVNEFSTDGTMADNSDTAVPTERAVKTYVDNEIGAISQTSLQVGIAPSETKVEATGTGATTDTIDFDVNGEQVAQIGKEHLTIPQGTTAERPGTPTAGMIRYNTTLGNLEAYSTSWGLVGSAEFYGINIDPETGDLTVTTTNNGTQNVSGTFDDSFIAPAGLQFSLDVNGNLVVTI